MRSLRNNTRATALACGAILAGVLSASAASASYVVFHAGTYDLSDVGAGDSPTDLLTITVSGGIATFTVSGGDTATWQIPDHLSPDNGFVSGGPNPVFSTSIAGASWSTATFPFITFWDAANDGGLTIADAPGDPKGPDDFLDLFRSSDGPSVVFSLVPEPTEWALMLAGFAGLGAMMRARRAPAKALRG